MDWYVIVNPSAGGGRGQKKWPLIQAELIKAGFQFKWDISVRKNQIVELAEKAVKNGYKKFIIVGGDGSIFEAVNGILSVKSVHPQEIYMAHIPVGTGNDWGKMYENSQDFRRSIEIIKAGNTILQDIGVIRFISEDRQIYFVNIAGLGFDAEVLKEVWRQKDKGRDGTLIYLLMLLKTLLRSGYYHLTLNYNGKTEEKTIFSMAAGIGRYNGNGMMQLPFSHPADGLLDLSIINKISKPEVLMEVKNLYQGTFVKNRHVSMRRTPKILIESDKAVPVEADGEFLGYTPVEISLIPGCINFYVNQTDFKINPKIITYAPDFIPI